MRSHAWSLAVLLCAACGGPHSGMGGPGKHVIVSVPPRPAGCSIEYKTPAGGEADAYELIGSLTYDSGVDSRDPFAESIKASVGPRACGLGGERVGFAASPPGATSQYTYWVFRAKPATH